MTEEETESAAVLKLMFQLQAKQEQMRNLPEYEQELYRRVGTKHQMDKINFNKEETVVFDGHYLPDIPLADPLFRHRCNGATITQVVRELDMTKKPPIKIKGETYGIYGYCDMPA